MEKHETWFLVMDSKNATIYSKNKLEYLERWHMAFTPRKTHENDNTRNSLPRAFESIGMTKHIIEPHTDQHTKEQMEFISSVNQHLKTELQNNICKKLVLIAPPKMLGLLRKHLDKHILNIVTEEINKEMANLDNSHIIAILKDIHP